MYILETKSNVRLFVGSSFDFLVTKSNAANDYNDMNIINESRDDDERSRFTSP